MAIPVIKQNTGPTKKLLVLCLDGLLANRIHFHNKFTVHERPFCYEFLKFCFQRFDVGLWCTAKKDNLNLALYDTGVPRKMRNKLLFKWGQEKCTYSGFKCLHKKPKPVFLKELIYIWEVEKYKGKYSATNTLLIDTEPHTSLLNPPNTAIFPERYKEYNLYDNFLGPKGDLRKFLNGLVHAEDVPSYVKDHPLGQPAITPSHPDWSYYSEIVQNLGKKEEGTKTSAEIESNVV